MDDAPRYRAVIIDLDGTLVDSAGEIATALDRTFDDLGLARVGKGGAATMIGRGVGVLVERALARVGANGVDHRAAVA